MRKKKRPLAAWKVLVTIVIIVLSMAIVGLVVFNAFFKKDGLPGIIKNVVPKPNVSSTSSATNDEGKPILDGERKDHDVYNFLVVGINDDIGNHTDSMLIAQYNVTEQQINIVQIMRDTYARGGKINSVYPAAYNSVGNLEKKERRNAAMQELVKFIESSFTVKIDFYVAVDLAAFQGLIDSMNDGYGGKGLRVNVPCDMDYEDSDQDLYIHLRAGEQTLNGYDAMCMVRNRHTYADADFGRLNVQKIFMSALLKQAKNNLTNVDTLKELINISFNNLTTNLTLDNCIYFATHALDLDMSKMKMLTLPIQTIYASTYTISEPMAVRVVNEYLNVFNEPITAETFDPNYQLTNRSDKAMYNAYLTWDEEIDVYDADTVDRESIDLNILRGKN